MVSERRAEADDRAVPGHRDGDLIRGVRSSAIGTLEGRITWFTMLLLLPPEPGHRERKRVQSGNWVHRGLDEISDETTVT